MPLIQCTDCRKDFSDQAAACPNCGKPNSKKYCKHCGLPIDKECGVCPECGKQVEELSSQHQDKNIVINNNNNNSASASSSASAGLYNMNASPMGKRVNKVAYILLALFLGGIGIHKFYSGKILVGFLYVIFCWSGITVFLGIIDAIIALFKPANENGFIYV